MNFIVKRDSELVRFSTVMWVNSNFYFARYPFVEIGCVEPISSDDMRCLFCKDSAVEYRYVLSFKRKPLDHSTDLLILWVLCSMGLRRGSGIRMENFPDRLIRRRIKLICRKRSFKMECSSLLSVMSEIVDEDGPFIYLCGLIENRLSILQYGRTRGVSASRVVGCYLNLTAKSKTGTLKDYTVEDIFNCYLHMYYPKLVGRCSLTVQGVFGSSQFEDTKFTYPALFAYAEGSLGRYVIVRNRNARRKRDDHALSYVVFIEITGDGDDTARQSDHSSDVGSEGGEK